MIKRITHWMNSSLAIRLKNLTSVAVLSALTSNALATADLVVINADVRTANPSATHAQAFAIKDGQFLQVGNSREIQSLINTDTKVIDAKGKTVIPGLVDGHTHLHSAIDLVRGVDLYGLPKKSDWLEAIVAIDKQLPPDAWILGGRWDHTLAEKGVLPTKEDLDAVMPDRPVMLRDIDHHSVWVNSKALELAGITKETAVPEGGEILRDSKTGEPTGILKETAIGLVMQSAAYSTYVKGLASGLRDTVRYVNSMGVTSVHDMADVDAIQNYLKLLEADQLSLRVWFGAVSMYNGAKNSEEEATEIGRYASVREQVADRVSTLRASDNQGPLLQLGYVKVVYDGVLSTYTAALKAPYSDKPQVSGQPFFDQTVLTSVVRSAAQHGFPVAVHAIGDKSVSQTLDTFASVKEAHQYRNRIEHIELVDPADIQRFKAGNVTASMQPNHGVMGDYILERIGEEREPHAYAWKEMLAQNVDLVLGSDWPTALLDPLTQLGDAVLRERNGKRWQGDNALNFDEALYAYTQAGADMAGWGEQIGSIQAGKWADFVMLDGRLPVPLDASIRERTVQATYLGGEVVYQAE